MEEEDRLLFSWEEYEYRERELNDKEGSAEEGCEESSEETGEEGNDV